MAIAGAHTAPHHAPTDIELGNINRPDRTASNNQNPTIRTADPADAPVNRQSGNSHGMGITKWLTIGFAVLGTTNFGAGFGTLKIFEADFNKKSTNALDNAKDSCRLAVDAFQEYVPNITETCDSDRLFMVPTFRSHENANFTGSGIEYGGIPLATIGEKDCKVDPDVWCDKALDEKNNPFTEPAKWALASSILSMVGSGFIGATEHYVPNSLISKIYLPTILSGLSTLVTIAGEADTARFVASDPNSRDTSPTITTHLATLEKGEPLPDDAINYGGPNNNRGGEGA